MNFLKISHKPPVPAIDGGCIAMLALTEGLLARKHSVKELTLATQKHPFLPEKMPSDYREKTKIESVSADTTPKAVPALMSLLQGNSYNMSRFDVPEFRELVAKTLQEKSFDAIILESLFSTACIPEIRKHSDAPILLRSHNVEYEIWLSLAINSKNPVKKQYLYTLASSLKKAELAAMKQVDGIAFISPDDARTYQTLGYEGPSMVLPMGLDRETFPQPVTELPAKPTLLFLGALDWSPNREGLDWFLKHCWPSIREAVPETQFVLAGRNAPEKWVEELPETVDFRGEVVSQAEILGQAGIVLVPLLSGSGIRIKILEALSWGKGLISTPIGVQGLGGVDGKHWLVSDQPNELSEKVIFGLRNPQAMVDMGKEARSWVMEHFDNQTITAQLEAFVHQLRNA